MTLQISSPAEKSGPIYSIDISETLPNFVVVTGKNGAGKSQLLHGMSTGKIPTSIDGQTTQPDDICLINYNSIPQSTGSPPNIWREEIQQFWTLFTQARNQIKTKLLQSITGIDKRLSGVSEKNLYPREQRLIFLKSLDIDESLISEWIEKINTISDKFDSELIELINKSTTSAQAPKSAGASQTIEYRLKQQLQRSNTTIEQLCKTIFSKITSDLIDIKYDDLAKVWPPNALGSGYFTETISAWFQKYAEALEKHLRMKAMKSLEDGTTVDAEEFLDEYGPLPWKVVDEILEEAGIPYTITSPDTNHLQAFKAVLEHKITIGNRQPRFPFLWRTSYPFSTTKTLDH